MGSKLDLVRAHRADFRYFEFSEIGLYLFMKREPGLDRTLF